MIIPSWWRATPQWLKPSGVEALIDCTTKVVPFPISIHLQFAAEHGDYVIRGDYADEFVVFVDHREGNEIVFVEKLGDLVLIRCGVSEDERLLGERHQES